MIAGQPAITVATASLLEDSADNVAAAMSSQIPQEVPIVSSSGRPSSSLPAPAMQSNAPTVDPRPNPRYVSHILPIFTEQYGREQQMQEKNRAVEAERQRRAKLSKQGVIIYAWHEVRISLLLSESLLLLFIGQRATSYPGTTGGIHVAISCSHS